MRSTVLRIAALACSLMLTLGAFCPGSSTGTGATTYHRVELSWTQNADLDLHIWVSPTSQCSQDGCTIDSMSMSPDVTEGPAGGTEIFYLDSRTTFGGTLSVGVNFHEVKGGPVGPRDVTLRVYRAGSGAPIQTYSYRLTTPIGHGGYPVTGNTASWWRPVDILVSGGTISLRTPDNTPLDGRP